MGTKITALPPILTVENTDVLPIVDITDTTTKKITIAQIETKLSASFLSSGDNISLLTNDSGYITVSDFSNDGENAGVDRDLGNLDAFALSFITSGVGRINIEAGGNVGIGTSTPSTNFHVNGGLQVDLSSTVKGTFNYASNTNGMVFNNNSGANVESMKFNTNTINKHHNFTFYENSVLKGAYQYDLSNNATRGDGFKFYAKTFATNAETLWLDQATDNVIIPNGNVGIGTATPTETLEVAGKVLITQTDGLQLNQLNGRITIGNTISSTTHFLLRGTRPTLIDLGDATTSHFKVNSVGQTLINGTSGAAGYLFRVDRLGGTYAFTVRGDDGNVGINTSTPTAKLNVVGTTYLNGNVGIGISPNLGVTQYVKGNVGDTFTCLIETSANDGKLYVYESGRIDIQGKHADSRWSVGGLINNNWKFVATGTAGVNGVSLLQTSTGQSFIDLQESGDLNIIALGGGSNIGLGAANADLSFLRIAGGTVDKSSLTILTGVRKTIPTAGDIIFDGTNFEGYNGSAWVTLG